MGVAGIRERWGGLRGRGWGRGGVRGTAMIDRRVYGSHLGHCFCSPLCACPDFRAVCMCVCVCWGGGGGACVCA